MKEMESSMHEQSLDRMRVQTRTAIMWVMSEPRFAEEIDALGDDNELTNYALEKFVEEGLAEKFALFYDSNEIKKLAFEINKAVSATGDSEKEKMNRAFGEAMATKIFEMIKASK